MNILFIQHVSVLGGSSKSLFELISNLPKEVTPFVLCPKGSYSTMLESKGIKVFNIRGIPQFDNTQNGYYRGLRWAILLRELFYLPFLILKLMLLKKYKFEIVHVNDSTQIYSIIFSKLLFNKVVVHVRALQRKVDNFRYKFINYILKKYSDKIIAIDQTVRSSLDESLDVVVIHNGITLSNIQINKKKKIFSVGIVANFQRYKGIIEFVDSANYCINILKLDMKFHIFGASYHSKDNIKSKVLEVFGFREKLDDLILKKIDMYKLKNSLILHGFKNNLNEIYNEIDILTFPSHLKAVGRPVFEAAFYNIPSIVAIEKPLDDTIIDMKTGICIKEKDFLSLSNAIDYFYKNRLSRANMGKNAYNLVNKLYNSEINAQKIFVLYQNIIYKKK